MGRSTSENEPLVSVGEGTSKARTGCLRDTYPARQQVKHVSRRFGPGLVGVGPSYDHITTCLVEFADRCTRPSEVDDHVRHHGSAGTRPSCPCPSLSPWCERHGLELSPFSALIRLGPRSLSRALRSLNG